MKIQMNYLFAFFRCAALCGGLSFGGSVSVMALPQETVEDASDPRTQLQRKLCESFWRLQDKNNRIREKHPALIEIHKKMTQAWIAELEPGDFELLTREELSKEELKEARELEKTYREQAMEVVTHHQLAHKLAVKVTNTHWKGMAAMNVSKESFPEYTQEFDETVFAWFQERSMEDLILFEKPRPKPNERERGEKITADLLKTIEAVQQKHESKWSLDF